VAFDPPWHQNLTLFHKTQQGWVLFKSSFSCHSLFAMKFIPLREQVVRWIVGHQTLGVEVPISFSPTSLAAYASPFFPPHIPLFPVQLFHTPLKPKNQFDMRLGNV
jgi:hypothetical protein